MMLVTLQQVRDQIRSDTDFDEADLTLKIAAASAAVMDYLGSYTDTFTDSHGDIITDSQGDPVVPARVQQATLATVAYFFRERDGSQEHRVTDGYGYALPQSATALLYSLRRPVMSS